AGVALPLRIRGILQVGGRDDALRVLEAGRLDHAADGRSDVVEDVKRLPLDLIDLLDRLRGEFRGGDVEEYVGARSLQLDDVIVDGGFGDLVAFLRHDHRGGLGAEAVLEALDVVFAVIVVLVEDGDLGVRLLLQEVLGIDMRLTLVVGLPAHGPGEVLRVVPLGGAGGDEELRYLLGIHVFVDRRIRRRAERVEDQQHLVALDQLAGLLDRLRWRVGVVIGDEIDLSAVDPTRRVDLVEIGLLGLADHAIGRSGTAIGHDVADLDLGVGGAGVVFLLRERTGRRRGKQNKRGRSYGQTSGDNGHYVLPQ